MTTRHILSNVMRPVVAAVCLLSTASCGSEAFRTGRSPVFLSIIGITTTNGASEDTGPNLLSDVQTLVDRTINGETVKVPTIFNDTAVATITVVAKDQLTETTAINAVTITRYRINFRRTDGRNTPGVDVPFGWDGGVSVTIPAGGSASVGFEIVRHSSKSEPPLRNLVANGGQQFIYTVAEVTFFGHDQNGNEVAVTGLVDVAFSDFGDPD